MKRLKLCFAAIFAVLMLASCSPYASLDVGVPFNVGPVYVNPSIGVGGHIGGHHH